jgi:uncharacterized membrane protein
VKKYLVAGLLVWLPLAITIWVLSWVLGVMDGVFVALLSATQAVLPESARAGLDTLRHVPGLGVVVMLVGLLLTGVFAANMFGQWWLRQGDLILRKTPIVKSIYNSVKQVSDTLFSTNGNAFREAVLVQYPRQGDLILRKTPIVKSIYNSVKQVSDTLFSTNGNAFREAVLVQYPRQGSWTIAFVTGKPGGEVAAQLPGDYVSVYVPTTPNPTSGFFLMMPRSDILELTMSVDEALKYVISMGVVSPGAAPAPPPAVAARN